MRYLPEARKIDLKFAKLKRWCILFVVGNVVAFIFLPVLFYGFWDTVGGISKGMAESRKVYFIKRTRGRTMADLYVASRTWKEAFKGMNPMEWGK